MFSKNDLPVVSDEVARPGNIQQREYLQRIITEMKVNKNLDVKLLTKANYRGVSLTMVYTILINQIR